MYKYTLERAMSANFGIVYPVEPDTDLPQVPNSYVLTGSNSPQYNRRLCERLQGVGLAMLSLVKRISTSPNLSIWLMRP